MSIFTKSHENRLPSEIKPRFVARIDKICVPNTCPNKAGAHYTIPSFLTHSPPMTRPDLARLYQASPYAATQLKRHPD